jgi:hypothetical protein
MYVCHAWIELHAWDETIEADRKFERDLTVLRALLDENIYLSGDDIRAANGIWTLTFTLRTNHVNMNPDVLALLEWIAREMKGSHGLVYWQDDEIPADDPSAYHVIVLRKGVVEHRADPFLSPSSLWDWDVDEEGRGID